MFAVAAAVLLLVTMAFVLWPLWYGMPAGGSRREANVAVYEQHVAEIQRQLAAQQITAVEAKAQRNELDARLLSDVDDAPATGHYVSRRPWLASTAIVIGFAVVAIGGYSLLGDPRGVAPQQQPDITALVAKMKTRLAAVPGDLQTRALLGQVQMVQQKYAAAAVTFAQLNAGMAQPDTVYLVAEARARVLSNGGRVDDRAQALYQQVLALQPDNAEALWFAGLAAVANGNKDVAARHWQQLLAQDLPAEFHARVQRRLAELRGNKPELGGGQ